MQAPQDPTKYHKISAQANLKKLNEINNNNNNKLRWNYVVHSIFRNLYHLFIAILYSYVIIIIIINLTAKNSSCSSNAFVTKHESNK